MQKGALRILGVVLLAFLVGVAAMNPFASAGTLFLRADAKPPPFQVLTDNFDQFGGSWIGGVAGYNTVTIILSANCATAPTCAHPRDMPVVSVYFQTGSTIPETPLEFSWSAFPSPMTQPYAVPRAAETIIILVTNFGSTSWPYSLAISLK